MKKKKNLLSFAILVVLIIAFSRPILNIPPLGKVLDPFVGIVQNNEDSKLKDGTLKISKRAVSENISVFFDRRKVPHIYAKNTKDLYFAQGYVTAYFRLWQMDFLCRASGGSLSEMISGNTVLQRDRKQRRQGILTAAKSSLELIEKDSLTNQILTAYTRGVNAYIDELDYKNMPVEYKILDFWPEAWTNLKSVLIMKYMAEMLSGHEEDVFMSKMIMKIGERKFAELYPDFHKHISPIIGTSDFFLNNRLAKVTKPMYLNNTFLSTQFQSSSDTYNSNFGSNSWVISGNKTKSGYPILANDPHLAFSLPSIWIEMQLTSPLLNVYGVSIPGTPAIIVGFNEHIAWGITNGADDVKDWYKLKVSDDYKKYKVDGRWLDLHYNIEEIKRKGQSSFFDTLYTTIYGPIVNNKDFRDTNSELNNYALKWELHKPSNEFLTFINLNRSKNYKEFKSAITNFKCPIQNFMFACKDNSIAVVHQGNLPIKKPFQGKFLMDGTKSYDLTDYIPSDSLPQILNPDCDYVISANQHPTYSDYPYYYNGYYNSERANRISYLLKKGGGFDIEANQRIQLDNVNHFAYEMLPILIEIINHKELNTDQRKRLDLLSRWNGDYSQHSENPVFFELWWNYLKMNVWGELLQDFKSVIPPDDYVFMDLIALDSENIIFDKKATLKRENAKDRILEAFMKAFEEYSKLKSANASQWGDHHKVYFNHPTNIQAFGKLDGLASEGTPHAINAIGTNWGPSWRMIVELGKDKPNAYGIMPGGESGNLSSSFYDNTIDDWINGKYYQLEFFISVKEASSKTNTKWTIDKRR